jgi:hypothetical protein
MLIRYRRARPAQILESQGPDLLRASAHKRQPARPENSRALAGRLRRPRTGPGIKITFRLEGRPGNRTIGAIDQ